MPSSTSVESTVDARMDTSYIALPTQATDNGIGADSSKQKAGTIWQYGGDGEAILPGLESVQTCRVQLVHGSCLAAPAICLPRFSHMVDAPILVKDTTSTEAQVQVSEDFEQGPVQASELNGRHASAARSGKNAGEFQIKLDSGGNSAKNVKESTNGAMRQMSSMESTVEAKVATSDYSRPTQATDHEYDMGTVSRRNKTGENSSEICLPGARAQYAPQEMKNPGKKATDFSKKSKAEPRPANEHHSVNMASVAVPHGSQMAPVGREETASVAVVQKVKSSQPVQAAKSSQPALAAKSSQPALSAKSSQPALATKSSQPAQAAKSSQSAQAAKRSQSAQAAKSSQPVLAAKSSQSAQAAKSSQSAQAAKRSQSAQAAKSSQPVLAAKSSQPAQAANEGYAPGKGLSRKEPAILDVAYDYLTKEAGPGEAFSNSQSSRSTDSTTRSHSSVDPTVTHGSVAAAYMAEQCFVAQNSRTPQPNTVHESQLTIGKSKGVSPMLKVLKKCADPTKYFDRHRFLEALQLESLLPRMEVDTSLYITNRAKLEQMYPYLPQQKGKVAEVVYSALKHAVSKEEEARAVREEFLDSSRVGWNALKDCQNVKYLNVESIARKLLPPDAIAKWWEERDNWQGVVKELHYFLKQKAERSLTRPRVVHALFVAAGDVPFISNVIQAGQFVSSGNPTLIEIEEFISGLPEPMVFGMVFTELIECLTFAGERGLANELEEQRVTQYNPLHLFGLWLTTAASTSRLSTWADFVQLLKKGGVNEGVIQTIPGGPWDSSQPDFFHVHAIQQQPVTVAAVQELSSKQIEQPRVWNEQPHANLPAANTAAASNTLRTRESEEEHYLSLQIDTSDVKSILYHAKAVYLTLDYANTRRILDILAHHLLIDEEMLRVKVFGYGISYYHQGNFPHALERLDELEKLALEHHSAGDVSLSCIYRGEIYMAQKKLDQAFCMFDHARATYDANNVATYYGIDIVSKCSVMVKAANCQKQLMDYKRAKEVYQMAIEFAERVRHAKEALPQNEPDRKHKVEAAYRDEITVRGSLGNLFQNLSDCASALDQYEIVLHLQGKIEGDGAALGWAEGNYGNALLGLNRMKEAIPHLQKAFELARKHEKLNQGISRAASNLGNAFQAAKLYDDAQNSFEIALGHSVFAGDEAGHARALGNLGNVKLVKGEPLEALRCYNEALRCYNEALSLKCDETSLHTAYQNRASVYITLAAKVNEGVGEWDAVPEDIEAEEPREAVIIQLPLEEQTREVETIRRQHMVLPSENALLRGVLDDSETYFKKDDSPTPPLLPSGAGTVAPSAGGPLPSSSSTCLGSSHTHYLKHRQFYLLKAEEDLRIVVQFVEDRFAKVKGKEDTNSLALSIFEANSKAFYSLQKVLVCLGRSQEALMVAEANRARNLGELMLSAKQSTTFNLSNVRVPLDLSSIWRFANSEQTPVAVLSCDMSCILVHIIVPRDDCRAAVPVSGHGHQQTFTSALRGSEETIPANCYHFIKIELFNDTFTDEWSRNRDVRPTSDSITFEQYVTKNLMEFLNEKETNIFETVDFEPQDNPLTVLFDQFARKFAEVIEATAPEFHELVVIGDQALHLLPWPVLQDKASRKFLGDRYRIRTYPSILSMGVISSQPAPVITFPSEERFLVVGNPAIPKFINQKKEITLRLLPRAEDEATQVSHILETTPLLREQATKQTVIYRLQMASIVHIATHGSGSQGYIALASNMPVLSNTKAVDAKDCLLFIDEIQKLHINASLVVLSACDSARGEIVNEGVNSVARAILAAGAQSVLVSLVRVPDKSASIFMRLFYRFLAHDGLTTSEALQKSSMGVRCIKSLSQHVHWGGFQLIGRNISIAYNKTCKSAKVAALVGDPTPLPRLEQLQQLERAIFRSDRTPPRDVVLVKGLSFNDPAELVRDFICKHFKHYPGGMFWYNAASEDLLDASVSFVKGTMPHLKTILREPPVEKANTDKKKRNMLEASGGESNDNHYRLIILDHPASLAACLKKIPKLQSSHSDIILIHTADTDRDQSLTRWVDEKLVRGCTPIVAGHLDKYDAIQRMAYSILRIGHIAPYEEDYEAFDVLQQFCRGCSSLVRMLEGMLCREEPHSELRKLAADIEVAQNMEPVVTRPELQDLPQTSPVAEKKGSFFKSRRHSKSKDKAKAEGRMRNGLISVPPELTAEDHVQLSNGYEKPARLLTPIGTLLETRMTPEEHFLLTALGYITLYPESHSEGAFTFTDQFSTQLATVIAEGGGGTTTEPYALVKKLEDLHVIRQYPLPVLSPPDYNSTFKLFYVPDSIARAVTFDLEEAEIAFILTTCSTAVQHLSEPLSYHTALKRKVGLLSAEFGLPNL